MFYTAQILNFESSFKLPKCIKQYLPAGFLAGLVRLRRINIQIEKVTGLTVEAAVKKIRKFVNLNKETIQSSEGYLSINIMLCLVDIEKVRKFLDENTRIYPSNLSQKELFA